MKGLTKQAPGGISFAGKVVLVTGAAGGIGRAMALAFGRAGACVVIADTSVDGGHMTAALIVEAGGKALFVKTNVTSAAEVDALIDKVVAHYGRIDCAVNGAAIEEEHLPLADGENEQFDRIMNVNVKGVWLCMKSQLRQMLKQEDGGVIVNVADAGGLVAAPNRAVYAASKHAVVGLTRTAAVEYAKSNIRVNSICPGAVKTPMLARMLEREPGRDKKLKAAHPMGRIADAAEVANAALWLCSDQASFVTGHQLAIDGGLTAM
ncbi:SDR family oxidoreductase [Massilia forsythiae]|uniref:SDR family oxidoreductase n=1 Tax=Massilia forsythiae TaxID=2728020 RepID=A0A7Z2ZV47_9BURK|nr:SDR family oxidoreductase [Massilia forsythiae]QJE03114.1 SDR family oxidoreductase [Massilia forsythiae]